MTHPSGKSQNTKGMIMAFAGFSSFACSDATFKWLSGHYSITQVIFFDNAFAALILLALLPFLGGVKALTQSKAKALHLLRVILNIMTSLIVAQSFSTLPLADVYTVLFAFPLFSTLLAIPLYKQAVQRKNIIAIAVGFAGVIIALKPGAQGFSTDMILPLFASILIALLFTIPRSMPHESPVSFAFWPFLGTALAMIPLLPAPFVIPALPHLGLMFLIGLFIASGMIFVSMAFRLAPAASVSPLQYTEMVWAIVFGLILFGDVPSLMMLCGAGVIILSGLYLVWHERG